MTTDRLPRLRPGMTRDPYDCCGKAAEGRYGRPKGKICGTCAALIADGKIAREQLAAQGLAVYQWTEKDYAWPRFYGADAQFPHTVGGVDLHKDLAVAFWALVNRLAVDAPGDTPNHAPTFTMAKRWDGTLERRYDSWPTVLSDKGHSHDSWSWEKLVLLPPATRETLDALHQTIKAALAGVYKHGKDTGGSVLMQLASGSMSLQDFDESLLTAAEREAARKARGRY